MSKVVALEKFELNTFLSGAQFSSSLAVAPRRIASSKNPSGRDLGSLKGRDVSLIRVLAPSDDVLHIGCADHAPLIESKITAGSYLHALIENHLESGTLWGLDSNESALDEMRRLGFSNVTSSSDSLPKRFDVVLLPDTIEHLQDPGAFLEEIRQKFSFRTLAVTVPNAYSMSNRFFFQQERINSDHRSLHGPYSLSKLLYEAGYRISTIAFADYGGISRPLTTFLKWRFPLMREHLIVLAEPSH